MTRVAPGTRLTVTYTVSNPTTQPITARFSSGQQFEMRVTNTVTQEEVWRASKGMMYTMSLTAATLGNGESKTYTGTWAIPANLPVGRYNLTATLTPMGNAPRGQSTAATAMGVVDIAVISPR